MKHKKEFFLFVCFLSLGLFSACSAPVELAKQTFPMELGADVYANPNLYVKNAQDLDLSSMEVICQEPGVLKVDNRFITIGQEYLMTGEYDFVLREGQRDVPFLIKVKDTLPPAPRKNPERIETSIGVQPDWAKEFDAEDLSGVYYSADSELVQSTGEKEAEVTIADRFGNSVVKKVKLNVNP